MLFLSTLLISMFITMALIPILRMAAPSGCTRGWTCPMRARSTAAPMPKVGGLAMAVGALVPVLFWWPTGGGS